MILSKKAFNFLYGMGAAVVIVGVLFKLIHLGGALANFLLVIGMGSEAVIFALSAFDTPEPEYDWSKVYPELATESAASEKREKPEKAGSQLTNQLDKMLEEAHFDKALLVNLRSSIEKLEETASGLGSTSEALKVTQQYEDQLTLATTHIQSLNALYNIQLEKNKEFTKALSDTAENSKDLKDQFSRLSNNLTALNQVYGGMLSAMKTKPQ